MIKVIALFFALISGAYLLLMGLTPDPLPFLDEGVALVILVKSMAVLGIDLGRFLPFMGRKGKKTVVKEGQVVDV